MGCKYKKAGFQLTDLHRLLKGASDSPVQPIFSDLLAGTPPTTADTTSATERAAWAEERNTMAGRIKELETSLAGVEKTNARLEATVDGLKEERDSMKTLLQTLVKNIA